MTEQNTDAAHRNMVEQLVVRIPPSWELLVCDFCGDSETSDCHKGHDLRPMYRLDDDCVICQVCLDAGEHNKTANSLLAKPATKPCTWTEDADGNWNTGCQEIHIFISGTPQENGYVYCPYCGGQIRLTGDEVDA